MGLAKQAALKGLEIRPCKLRIIPGIKTALVNEISVRQRIFGVDVLSVKGLALHVASDHWPNLDTCACERHRVLLEKLLATTNERYGKWRYGLYVRVIDSDEIGMMGDDIVDLCIVAAPRTDVVIQKRKLVQAEKAGDFGRTHVEREIVERVFGVKLRSDVVLVTQPHLLFGRQISIPPVRSGDGKHSG